MSLLATLGGCAGYAGLAVDSPELAGREPRALARGSADPVEAPARVRARPAVTREVATRPMPRLEDRPSPRIGTPEFDAEKAEEARKERRINEVIQICRNC